MNNRMILIIVGLVLLVGVAIWATRDRVTVTAEPEPADFAECASRYSVIDGSPRTCVSASGTAYTEAVQTPATTTPPSQPPTPNTSMITVSSPTPDQTISSPLTVTGSARGNWYFEASFPVELRNASNQIIAQGPAQAQGNWMTTNFVPFSATLTYPAQPTGSQGTLILRKDNPSGLPQNDASVSIPVAF